MLAKRVSIFARHALSQSLENFPTLLYVPPHTVLSRMPFTFSHFLLVRVLPGTDGENRRGDADGAEEDSRAGNSRF